MFNDLGKIMKLTRQMKDKLPEMQEQIASARYSADVNGMVTATVNGRGALVNLHIDPEALADLSAGTEALADTITAAVAAAQRKAADAAADKMKDLTGGINIPGLDELMG